MNHTKKIFYRPHIIFQFVTESRLCTQVKFLRYLWPSTFDDVHFRLNFEAFTFDTPTCGTLQTVHVQGLEGLRGLYFGASTFDGVYFRFDGATFWPFTFEPFSSGPFNFELPTFRTSTSEPFTFRRQVLDCSLSVPSTFGRSLSGRQNLIDRT